MATYTDAQQRQMDAQSGQELDRRAGHSRLVYDKATRTIVRDTSAESGKGKALKVEMEGADLVIRLSPDALKAATEACPALERFADERNDFEMPTVTDAAAWSKEVLHALNAEADDGTTLVHKMFDRAFQNAIEAGAGGIKIPGDTD